MQFPLKKKSITVSLMITVATNEGFNLQGLGVAYGCGLLTIPGSSSGFVEVFNLKTGLLSLWLPRLVRVGMSMLNTNKSTSQPSQ